MFNTIEKVPSAEEIKAKLPLSAALAAKKAAFDAELKENFAKKSKLTVVVGPCSADASGAVEEYLTRLYAVTKDLRHLLVVARIYTAKPHSDGEGYLGLSMQDSVNAPVNVAQGLCKCRKLMTTCLEIGFPVADELLYLQHYPYLSDLVSYWFLGARSSCDAEHRNFAGGIDALVGVKNPVDGSLLATAQSVYAVRRGKTFLQDGNLVSTDGNLYAHPVLRGYSANDKLYSNFGSAAECVDCCKKLGFSPFVMVDASHGNSGKDPDKQRQAALSAAENPLVDGIMLESFLYSGKSPDKYGVSKTDACMPFDKTAELLALLDRQFALR